MQPSDADDLMHGVIVTRDGLALVTRFGAFAWFLPGFFDCTVRRTVVFSK
jgi:hypothetical protein